MECFIEHIATDEALTTDLKALIPDAAMRRRMSRIVRLGVSTAVECMGSVEAIGELDAVITATGWGCMADSERFLRNIIEQEEQLLNPTPFIQSTFNTVGAQIALLQHNHCYNVTYTHRSHSFEDALLDAALRIADGEASRVLVGAFDECTDTLRQILERTGWRRHAEIGEGCLFALLTAQPSERTVARITAVDFPAEDLSAEACRRRYATSEKAVVLQRDYAAEGLYPTVSAKAFAEAAALIAQGEPEVIVYHKYWGATPTIVVLRCIG